MPGKRKYVLNSLPEEAKNLLSIEEKVLFDQRLEILSKEDQILALKARSKISRYMVSIQTVKSPRMPRLDYQEIPECIWHILSTRFEPAVPNVKTLLQTPPRQLSEDKKNQRHMLAAFLRQLVYEFFYGCEFFNLDRVSDATWIILERDFFNAKILVETLPHSEKDRMVRTKILRHLFNLYKKQPQRVLITNFKVNNTPVTLIRTVKTFLPKTRG